MKFRHAVSPVNADRSEDALPLFAAIFARDGNWRVRVPRRAVIGLLAVEPASL